MALLRELILLRLGFVCGGTGLYVCPVPAMSEQNNHKNDGNAASPGI